MMKTKIENIISLLDAADWFPSRDQVIDELHTIKREAVELQHINCVLEEENTELEELKEDLEVEIFDLETKLDNYEDSPLYSDSLDMKLKVQLLAEHVPHMSYDELQQRLTSRPNFHQHYAANLQSL